MQLDGRQTFLVAILVLFLGKFLNRKIPFLREYNIPEPVSGGVLVSVLFSLLYATTGIEIEFYLASRDALLIVFFTTIGLTAQLSTLAKGGKPLAILLVLAVLYLFIQNLTGIAVVSLFGASPQTGILGGSVSLSGGHGTAIAWAPRLVTQYGLSSAMEMGIACATFGLVLGGVIGGPIAKYLIHRHKLEPALVEEPTVGLSHQSRGVEIDYNSMLRVFFVLCLAMGVGIHVDALFVKLGLDLPEFVSCLFAGIILTNTIPYLFKRIPWDCGAASLKLISDMSLGLFLAMSLMSLQLWTITGAGLSIVVLLAAQLIVVSLFSIFVIFRAMGKNYDAAVMASGYAGLALGATPTAIANMTAVTKKFGAAPLAFIIVPLVGAFFIDISNAVVIQLMLDWFT